MTLAIRRPVVLFVACASVGAVLAGCGSGPSKVGAAAIVGDHVVPLDLVQQQMNDVLATQDQSKQIKQSGKFDTVARAVVSLAVSHELISQVAAKEGISPDGQLVSQQFNQTKGTGKAQNGLQISGDMYRDNLRDQSVLAALGKKYANKLSVTFDFAQVADRATAKTLATQIVANPGKAKELLAAASASGSQPGVDQTATVAQSPQLAATPLFAVKPGSAVAFQPQGDGSGWVVAYITKRETNATSAEAVDPQAYPALGGSLLSLYSDDFKVTLNPRYGFWDQVNLGAVPSADEAFAFEVSPSDQNKKQ